MSSAIAFCASVAGICAVVAFTVFLLLSFSRVRFCTQTRGIGLALPQKTDSEGLPQIMIRRGCFATQ